VCVCLCVCVCVCVCVRARVESGQKRLATEGDVTTYGLPPRGAGSDAR
jgi:hypothetical protein